MSSWRNSYSSPMSQQQLQQQHQPLQATSFSPQPQYAMADAIPTNTTSSSMENGPRAKCDQVVFEAIAKAAEIVVGSRCWIDPMIPMVDNSNSSSSSRRFNLLVPEVQGVRTILQRWKRALHVPLRLDVYYQHSDSRRELLERWCLEYAPKPSHPGFGANHNTNPIVQLRHVCKQIVIWLRSLYCLSRMLPAQALRRQNSSNSAIGFSIYVVSEGNDDVSGLVSSQGFSAQQQPHSVWTPYGELGWKVFYAPKEVVQRLIPEKSPYTTSTARPIAMSSGRQSQPMSQQQQQQQPNSYHPTRDWNRRESDTSAMPTPDSAVGNIAQSAPHHASGRMYMRSQSDISEAQRHAMTIASSPVTGAMQQTKQKNLVGRDTLQHSETRERVSMSPKQKPVCTVPTDNTTVPPAKNRSALSLAMMMAGDHPQDSPGGATNTIVSQQASTANEAAEKRRVALHHAPPQLSQSPNVRRSPLATAGEYGYAYNSLIPPLRSENGGGTVGNDGGYVSSAHGGVHASPQFASSTPLGSTPPGYLLGGPTPPVVAPNLSTLIPPRGAVTPPFTRPMGFAKEAPRQESLLPPSAVSNAQDQSLLSQQELQSHNHPHADTTKLARVPMTSLDLLRSSPFQQPVYASMLGGMSGHASEPFMSFGSAISHGQSMEILSAMGGAAALGPRLQIDDHDDMPFAVETAGETSTRTQPSQPGASTTAMGSFTSSAMIRDMNHPPKRLQMFDSSLVAGTSSNVPQTLMSDPIDSLAEQLAEFKTFGESLVDSASDCNGIRLSIHSQLC